MLTGLPLPFELAQNGGMGGESGDEKREGPVPTGEIKEDSITSFDKRTGDSSRAFLWIVLAAAALLLLGTIFLTEAPQAQ
jgi:hypothetical protein